LSVGEMPRAELKNMDLELKQQMLAHMIEGTMVPVEITCKLLEKVSFQHLFSFSVVELAC
jgi:hypothetical protein